MRLAPDKKPPAARIVVVGGGFAGTNLVKALKGKLSAGASLTLVSDESYTCFNPMLAEVVGASIFPEQVVAPIREILRPDDARHFVMGRVSRIDLAERWLECDSLAGPHRIAYDELVLTVGNRARLDLIPGMQQHALPLKTMASRRSSSRTRASAGWSRGMVRWPPASSQPHASAPSSEPSRQS